MTTDQRGLEDRGLSVVSSGPLRDRRSTEGRAPKTCYLTLRFSLATAEKMASRSSLQRRVFLVPEKSEIARKRENCRTRSAGLSCLVSALYDLQELSASKKITIKQFVTIWGRLVANLPSKFPCLVQIFEALSSNTVTSV